MTSDVHRAPTFNYTPSLHNASHARYVWKRPNILWDLQLSIYILEAVQVFL